MKITKRIFLILAFVILFSMPFHAETRKTISKSTKKIEMTVGQLFRVKIRGGASARWVYRSNNTFMITRAGLLKARRAGQGKLTYKLNGKKRVVNLVIKSPARSASAGSPSGEESSGGGSSGSETSSGGDVYISATGSKYHRINNCGRMNPATSTRMTQAEAESRGYDRCSNCW